MHGNSKFMQKDLYIVNIFKFAHELAILSQSHSCQICVRDKIVMVTDAKMATLSIATTLKAKLFAL